MHGLRPRLAILSEANEESGSALLGGFNLLVNKHGVGPFGDELEGLWSVYGETCFAYSVEVVETHLKGQKKQVLHMMSVLSLMDFLGVPGWTPASVPCIASLASISLA